MPHYCNLFKDVPPSTLGPRQNISINANVRQLNSTQVEGKSFFSLAESRPEGRTLKVKRDVWFRWMKEWGANDRLNLGMRRKTTNFKEIRTLNVVLRRVRPRPAATFLWSSLGRFACLCLASLLSRRAAVCCYRLLQKLPLWPAVIPDHGPPTPQTKCWWMRQQIQSIKRDIAYSGSPARRLVLDRCIWARSFFFSLYVSSAVSSRHSNACWVNSAGLKVCSRSCGWWPVRRPGVFLTYQFLHACLICWDFLFLFFAFFFHLTVQITEPWAHWKEGLKQNAEHRSFSYNVHCRSRRGLERVAQEADAENQKSSENEKIWERIEKEK